MDYLNPDSLLKPTNAENSIYAPSFDQMLMAETKRGLMADELASNLNERNQNARILERYKLPMEMAKSDYELAEAQRKNSPEYLDAMIKGYIGDSQAKQAQGSKAMGTLEKDIALANMTNDVGIGQAEVLKQYAPLYRLNQKISTVMSSVPANKQQPYLKKILQDHFSAKENVNWLDPSYQKMLDDLTKDPRKLNNFITGQLNNVINQPQNFEWNKVMAEITSKERIANLEAAAKVAAQGKDDAWKKANALSIQALKYEDAAIKLEKMVQAGTLVKPDGTVVDLTKDMITKKELQGHITRLRSLAARRQSEADRLTGIEPMEEPVNENTFKPTNVKKWNPTTKSWEN